jgi:serine protease
MHVPQYIMNSCVLGLALAPLAGCDAEDDADLDAPESEVSERVLPIEVDDPLLSPFAKWSNQRWHYDAIRVREAWTLTTGSSGVQIAVADSGTLGHVDLDLRWSPGYDFFTGDWDPADPGTYHHGIHVAGTIGARANNQQGGAGICWSCPIMPLRIAQDGGGTNSGAPGANDPQWELMARAIRFAAGLATDNGNGDIVQTNDPADVINISVGNVAGPCPTDLNNAINEAAAAGTVVVVAAGNGDTGYQHPPVPDYDPSHYLWTTCNNPNLIVVTATSASGQAEPYALTGAGVTLAAPGGAAIGGGAGRGALIGCGTTPDPDPSARGGVVSTWHTDTNVSCYRYFAGTSMAAPHVSGVVGLIRSRNPALTVPQVKAILERTANSNIACGAACGAGLIDAFKAVEAATFALAVTCEATGGGHYQCLPATTGGAGPFTATWQGITNAGVSAGSVHSTGPIVGLCTANQQAKVRATFTDAIGRVLVKDTTFTCHWTPP